MRVILLLLSLRQTTRLWVHGFAFDYVSLSVFPPPSKQKVVEIIPWAFVIVEGWWLEVCDCSRKNRR